MIIFNIVNINLKSSVYLELIQVQIAILMLQGCMDVFIEVNKSIFIFISCYKESTQFLLRDAGEDSSHLRRVYFVVVVNIKCDEIFLMLF